MKRWQRFSAKLRSTALLTANNPITPDTAPGKGARREKRKSKHEDDEGMSGDELGLREREVWMEEV